MDNEKLNFALAASVIGIVVGEVLTGLIWAGILIYIIFQALMG